MLRICTLVYSVCYPYGTAALPVTVNFVMALCNACSLMFLLALIVSTGASGSSSSLG
jgi:hypothetical protein